MTDREKPVDRLDVDVSAHASVNSNCICDMCHATGFVIKAKIPETKFFDVGKLSTRYSELWMCESCRDKMLKAITTPFNRGENHD